MYSSARKHDAAGWLALLLIALIYYFANLQKVIVPGATFNELQEHFHIGAAQVTSLGAAFMYVYAAMQLLTGLMADRFSGLRVVAWGGLLLCLGGVLSALDRSFGLLLLARVLTGIGAATVYLSAAKELSRRCSGNLAMKVGVLTIIGYSGGITGSTPFIAGVRAYGYQSMMMAAGVACLVVYGVYMGTMLMAPRPPINRSVRLRPGTYISVLRKRFNLMQYGNMGISFGVYFALQTVIGKKFLEDFCGMSGAGAGRVLTIMMAIAALMAFAAAAMQKLARGRCLPFLRCSGWGCFGGAAALFLAVVLDWHCWWISATAMIVMALAGNMSSINVAALRTVNGDERFGTAMSMSNCFAYAVTAVLGGCLGRLMDVFPPAMQEGIKIYGRSSYLLVFGLLLALGCVSAVMCTCQREPEEG